MNNFIQLFAVMADRVHDLTPLSDFTEIKTNYSPLGTIFKIVSVYQSTMILKN